MQISAYVIGLDADAAADISGALARNGIRPREWTNVIDIAGEPIYPIPVFALVGATVEFRQDIKRLRADGMALDVVAVLPEASYSACADALRAGAKDVLAMPLKGDELQTVVTPFQTLHSPRSTIRTEVRPLEETEKAAITAALFACNGQVSLTARKLGIGRSTLYRKLEQYQIHNARRTPLHS